jgi:hypothetical protein
MLQGFAGGGFVAAGNYQEVTQEAVEVGIVESAVSHFIAFRHGAGECAYIHGVVQEGTFPRWNLLV